MAQSLSQYDRANVCHLIDGYMINRRPNESFEEYFERAKAQLILNLEKRLNQVRDFTCADFLKHSRKAGTKSGDQESSS